MFYSAGVHGTDSLRERLRGAAVEALPSLAF
jgi:hypothetical protein